MMISRYSLRILAICLLMATVSFSFSVHPQRSHHHLKLHQHHHAHQSSTFLSATPIERSPTQDGMLDGTTNPQQQQPRTNFSTTRRTVRRMEKYARLPVWPVWNGVFIWAVGKVLGFETAAKLENAITGRVCPNFYEYQETSPYIMLVHHCHSFFAWDPLRFVQRTFFPEGFPAHPHRGFITLTYILHGGFVHRDSEGVRQSYGAEERHQGKHTQWLVTGKGMLHEEMFDIQGSSSRQELYQIWLNVPAQYKMDEPDIVLLGGPDDTPLVETEHSKTLVLAGTYEEASAAAPAMTDLALFHVTLAANTAWTYVLPADYETSFLYVRQGTLTSKGDGDDGGDHVIPVHNTAYFESFGDCMEVVSGKEGADFMVLAGAPIREPCVASGSMVMNTANEIDQAYNDYQSGHFGQPWDHKLSDAEWVEHVKRARRRQ